jgi:hypothetical protein
MRASCWEVDVTRDREPERWFFMHIPKTAGMTLYHRLIRQHGAALYPLPLARGEPDAALDVEYMKDRFAASRDQIRMIVGHFPLCLGEYLGVPLTTFTIVRDPVERTLSLLRQRQQRNDKYRQASLEEIYADPYMLHGLIHNFTVKALTMTVDEMQYGVRTMVPYDEARLERAEYNLEHRIEVFGLQERFDEFCDDLAARFGWDLGDPSIVANRTAPADVSDEFRERIAYDNALDMQLYEFARDLLIHRRPPTAAHSA